MCDAEMSARFRNSGQLKPATCPGRYGGPFRLPSPAKSSVPRSRVGGRWDRKKPVKKSATLGRVDRSTGSAAFGVGNYNAR